MRFRQSENASIDLRREDQRARVSLALAPWIFEDLLYCDIVSN